MAILIQSSRKGKFKLGIEKMNNFRMMLYRFMQGRYGNDQFSQFLMIVGLILLIASNFLRMGLIHTLAWVLLFYAYFRVMSRNIAKRQQENFKFLNMKAKFLGRAGNKTSGQSSWKQRKAQKKQTKQQADYSQYQQQADTENYNYYRCRNCGQIVRVPKGKGTVKITCPECRNSFTDRT